MRKLNIRFTILMLALASSALSVVDANDSMYFVSGNQLVPLHDSDISVSKEVLAISIGDDGFAKVEVDYEFQNKGPAKTVAMGFEAPLPYNTGAELNPKGVHPDIFDFNVVFNGKKLGYNNAVVVASDETKPSDMKPLDLKQWNTAPDEDFGDLGLIISKDKRDTVKTAYAYYFNANFKHGINKVRHTYRFRMSCGVGHTFNLPYLLTPATRWAGGKIGDFTLIVKTPGIAKHFVIPNKIFAGTPFKVTSGKGKIREGKEDEDWIGSYTEVTLRDGSIEWHGKDFRPEGELEIHSADVINLSDAKRDFGEFYDSSDTYAPYEFYINFPAAGKSKAQKDKFLKRVMRNLPYAHRGYVFKDKLLQKYFDSKWWYMPDPAWKSSTKDFTKGDWKIIKESKQKKVILMD